MHPQVKQVLVPQVPVLYLQVKRALFPQVKRINYHTISDFWVQKF